MKSFGKKTKSYVLLGIIIIIALGLMALNKVTAKTGNVAEVSVDGQVIRELPLTEDAVFDIDGLDGNNHLIIKDGMCFIEEADCPDKLCVKQGKISEVGQSIICLPHRVVVTIKGESSAEVDTIAK